MKMNSVSNNAIWLRLFPFSLKNKAKSWLLNLMPILSLLGRLYPRLSFASTFPQERQPSFEMISHPFTKRRASPFMRLRKDSRSFKERVHTMGYQIGC